MSVMSNFDILRQELGEKAALAMDDTFIEFVVHHSIWEIERPKGIFARIKWRRREPHIEDYISSDPSRCFLMK